MTNIEIISFLGGIIGTVTGIGAFALGVANHKAQIKYASPKLRVIPKLAFKGPLDELVNETFMNERVETALERLKTFICIEVKNIGPNAQTIHEVGFIDSRGKYHPWRTPYCIEPEQKYPIEMPPDSIVSIYLHSSSSSGLEVQGNVYAKTDCGEIFTGTSPILTDYLIRNKIVKA